jgi:hypothetical protein
VPDCHLATVVADLAPRDAELFVWLKAQRQSRADRARVAPYVLMEEVGLKVRGVYSLLIAYSSAVRGLYIGLGI